MRKSFESILLVGIMVVLIVSPFIETKFDYRKKYESPNIKDVSEIKNVSIKEKEITEKQEDAPKKESRDVKNNKKVVDKKEKKKEIKKNIPKSTPKPTLKPTPKPTKKPTPKPTKKPIKKVNKQKQTTQKSKSVFYLSSYERRVAECIVMGESGSEPYKGQLMVAYCILNACKKDGLQPSEVRKVYKYSGWNTNPTKSVKRAVSSIFDHGHRPVNDTPLYFYAPKYCNSSWHETQRYITTIGGHKFFGRWK